MKSSILDEIRSICGKNELNFDRSNANRYRVILRDGYKRTAYCFSTPIYRLSDRKLIDLSFSLNSGGYEYYGSNANVLADNNGIFLKNNEGSLIVDFGGSRVFMPCGNGLRCGGLTLHPSLNGIAVEADCVTDKPLCFKLSTTKSYKIRSNNCCLAFMAKKFRPFASISAGCAKSNGRCYPINLTYTLNNGIYTIELTTPMPYYGTMLFEMNLYEDKLFQDTTVDSRNPMENNAYDSSAFLCSSKDYGEQWLYSRLDIDKLSDLFGLYVNRVRLYLPKYSDNDINTVAYRLEQRFCSFGSTWENKVPIGRKLNETYNTDDYYIVDISDLIIGSNHQLRMSEGILLKSARQGDGFSVIATGDNYFTPLILVIDFEK